jgi:hypothetical protein
MRNQMLCPAIATAFLLVSGLATGSGRAESPQANSWLRCGLLHQSEAEGTSRIKRGPLPLVALTADQRSIVVNVHRFHDLLKEVIESYAQELLHPKSVEARIAFRKKMNFVCRVEGKAI